MARAESSGRTTSGELLAGAARALAPDGGWLAEDALEGGGEGSGGLVAGFVRDRFDRSRRGEEIFRGDLQPPAGEESEDGLAHHLAEALGERAARKPDLPAE